MKTTFTTALFNTKELLPVAADVSKAKSNYGRQTAAGYREAEASNDREDIPSALESYGRSPRSGARGDRPLSRAHRRRPPSEGRARRR